ncbi:hypothetical protein BB558_000533 [Smittium angustum]|uniref:Flavin-nucleotide-binding protein n=1 Tax=Smittium angustum TaxID=133377 RepID=A0A2U1JDZ0_SMIAN|nr:hypothetical protein BB558_000533 [Smittium angustum]
MADYTPKNSKDVNFVKRLRERASYDPETIFGILDQGLISHVGFHGSKMQESDSEESWPFVIPMIYGRVDDTIYLHGYISGRLLKSLGKSDGSNDGPKACITVTMVDGLVVALSAFHNSNNYRSVCVFGRARAVDDLDEKLLALTAITNHQFRGGDKWANSREITKTELQTTKVIAVKIETASAKQRAAGPKDDEEDMNDQSVIESIWAGVVPIKTVMGKPQPAEYTKAPIPEYIAKLVDQE